MKKSKSVFIIVLIFLIGVSVSLYPSVSAYINKKNESKAVDDMKQAVQTLSPAKIAAAKKAVKAYNKSLVNNHIVLTDPFDPKAFPVTDGKYEELLTFSSSMASIEIPKIDVKLPIYHGTDSKTLEKGVGHLENTSLPLGGKSTHMVLSAHTGLPSKKLFSDLDQLTLGDVFYIYVLDEKLTYRVDQIKVVEPNDSSDLMIEKGKDYVTLVTCTPYGKNTHRLLVRGTRVPNTAAAKAAASSQKASLLQKLLMKYGVSLRELIVFASVAVLSLAFLIVILLTGKKKRRKPHEKENGTS